jgi:phenylpropionate dioxygenase-like ring-hydroxylating dioxygenase large terminal subunit
MPELSDIFKHFVPVLPSADVRDRPVPVRVANRDYVLFRDRAGRVGALLDRCAHRWTPLSVGKVTEAGRLQCAYHGWHFGVDGEGCAPSQPDLKGCTVPALQAIERRDCIWLANPGVDPATIDPMAWDEFFPANRVHIVHDAPLHVVLANLGDTEHSPYVHENKMLDEATLPDVDVRVTSTDDQVVVTAHNPVVHPRMARIARASECDRTHAEMIFRFNPLRLTVTFSWMRSATGEHGPVMSRAVIYVVPETDARTRLHGFTFLKMRGINPMWRPVGRVVERGFYNGILKQDTAITRVSASVPFETRGMRLGRHDRALPLVLKLLKKHCYTQADGVA